MTLETFKIALIEAVKSLVSEEVNVQLQKVRKNNGIYLEAVSLFEPGTYIAPSVYLEDLYVHYQQGCTIGELAKYVVYLNDKNRKEIDIPEDFFTDYQTIHHRICYRLINYEKNKEFLQSMPHRRFLDLAIVFYYLLDSEIMENASVLIRNEDMKRFGITQEELLCDASVNTKKLLPWKLFDMWKLMEEMNQNESELLVEDDIFAPMYVLTNLEKYMGATCILYPHVLEQIAEKLRSPFFILPSSIHECIILPDSGVYSHAELSEMVAEINRSQVDEVEVLSDQAYYYRCTQKGIQL